MRPLDPGSLSLNDVLAKLGYTKRDKVGAVVPSKEILDSDGVVVCCGGAGDVWEWLRRTKQITRTARRRAA